MRLTFRKRFIFYFLLPVLFTGFIATIVGERLISGGIIRQAQDKVRVDLNSAREIYQEHLDQVRNVIRFTAENHFIRQGLSGPDLASLKTELIRIRENENLDILSVTDHNGRVVFRAGNPQPSGDSQASDEIISQVLSKRELLAATQIMPREELLKEGDDLAERTHIQFIHTPRARLRPQEEETSGMIIKAAAPIFDNSGAMIGALYGGNVLNRDYKIVDKVKETVYQGQVYKGKDIGTATIFQGDLRISTNVTREDGSRAIGTRVSEEVYDQVIVKGLPWLERAFVVNDWYYTAYEPIKNIRDEIVGILYVGILEDKFVDMRRRTILIFLGITLLGMIIASSISYVFASRILQPIRQLVSASRKIAGGDLDHKVNITARDEIKDLGDAFNTMAASLKERDEQLKERTQQTLMRSERMATLGQLAAGVAHEINNPLGGVLTYGHLVLEDTGEDDSRRDNLEKLVAQANRCKKIVKGLLDFARQSEPTMAVADINETLNASLALVESQSLFYNIRVVRKYDPGPLRTMIDASQMQQVFLNIIINAAESMEGQGKLTLATRITEDGTLITIEVTDTGAGIPTENIDKLFDPFYTTKEVGRGTGLGLAISYGIVERHKGRIEVKSKLGQGTTFLVQLPVWQEVS
ncbi:MAG: cache domain-containing protein [Fidelibacterota bacterium]|nr:MAG: cache domain-containing protein [Candidatus Neomarinimicrobiota bacterium]